MDTPRTASEEELRAYDALVLQPVLQAGVDKFGSWWNEKQKTADVSERVTTPLYHYTDASGLQGILSNQEIWFTSIFHLNDPSEHRFGIKYAIDELKASAEKSEDVIRYMCDRLTETFLKKDLSAVFVFFVASFSKASDDLGQWRAYGDNGRGFALGLAPHLFHPGEERDRQPNEKNFVAPVVYGEGNARKKQKEAIDKAIAVIRETLGTPESQRAIAGDQRQGHAFIGHMCMELAQPILWNSLITKHRAYKDEQEVRLIIADSIGHSTLKTETRARKGELIPFVRSPLPIRSNLDIAEIMIGPAAAPSAKDGVEHLLRSLGFSPDDLVHRSGIPYRVT